ncbi:MAG: hypothetical protein JRF51_03530 [Deltaproteobacteria bacterium]|nr:hypothetical protein [Deltaproteobacteria bacterium]
MTEQQMCDRLKRASVFMAVFFIALPTALWSGCGKKAPPFLPENRLTLRVGVLTGRWDKGEVRLQGTISGHGKERSRVTGCRVYYAWYPADSPPCEGCPIQMKEFWLIRERVLSGDRFNCRVPWVKKEGVWYFQVRLTGPGGAVGPPSARVKVMTNN